METIILTWNDFDNMPEVARDQLMEDWEAGRISVTLTPTYIG